MCFSKEISLLHFAILETYAGYLFQYVSDANLWRLYVPMAYLGLKEILQSALYEFLKQPNIERVLAILSYVHICFQPLFVSIFMSYFSSNAKLYGWSYWTIVWIVCVLFAFYKLTHLDYFDILKDMPYCKDASSDFCSDENGAYQGKYHIGYKFKTKFKYDKLFVIMMFVPALMTKSYIIGLFFFLFAIILHGIYDVRDGEWAALWCLLVIAPTIPFTYFRKELLGIGNRLYCGWCLQ